MWTVLITILVHKSLIAFSLGLSAFKVFHHFKNCLYAMVIFCISRFGSPSSSSDLFTSVHVHTHGRQVHELGREIGIGEPKKVRLVCLLEHF